MASVATTTSAAAPPGATSSDMDLLTAVTKYLPGHAKKVSCLSWSCDGQWLASGSNDATIRLWKFDSEAHFYGKEVRLLRGHTAALEAIAWHPFEPHLLASVSSDKTLKIWDTRGPGRVDSSIAMPTSVYTLVWRSDGAVLAAGTVDDHLLLIDFRSGRPVIASKHKLSSDRAASTGPVQLNEVAWGPEGRIYAAVGNSIPAVDEGLVIIADVSDDFASIKQLATISAHTAEANVLKFEPKQRFFVTGGSDAVMRMWDAEELVCLRSFDRSETIIRGVSISHDSQYVVYASDDRVTEIVRLSDGSRVRGIPQKDAVNAVSWSPTHNILAFVCDDDHAGMAEKNSVRVLVPKV